MKSLNTRFREPLRRAIRAALGWLPSAFCGLGAGGGLLTAAGGDLRNTNILNTNISKNIHKHKWKEVLHTWKCWGCCLVIAPPVWVQLRAHPSNNAYPAHTHKWIRHIYTAIRAHRTITVNLEKKSRACRCVTKDSLWRGKGSHPSQRHWPGYASLLPCWVAAW